MSKGLMDTLVQPLFCLLNLLFGGAHCGCGLLQTTSTLLPEKFKNAYSFISTVRPTVQSNPSRKRSFSKTLFKPEEFENAGFKFSCGQKTFLNGPFRTR